MRIRVLLLSLLLIGAVHTETKAANMTATGAHISHSEYYATLPVRESPYADWKGVDAIAPRDAQQRNHYKFDYDAKGRLRQISFRLGERLKSPNHTANYFFLSSVIAIDFDDNKEIRHFFDQLGNPMLIRGDVFQKVFVLDDRGYKTALYFENQHGEKINNSWGIARYEWNMQPDGSVIEQRINLAGDPQSIRPNFEFGVLRLRYGPRGFLAVMSVVDPKTGNITNNKEGVAQDKLEFDAHGHMLAWNVLDENDDLKSGNGPGVARGIQTFTKQGYEHSIRFEDAAGNATQNSYGWWGGVRSYDFMGNMIRADFVDANGDLSTVATLGYAIRLMHYSKNGMYRTGIEYQDSDENPVLHATRGFASYTMRYDRNNQLTSTSYFDKKGNPVNRKDTGYAMIEYRYNSKNQRIEQRLLNDQGQLVNHSRDGWAIKSYAYDEKGIGAGTTSKDAGGRTLSKEQSS